LNYPNPLLEQGDALMASKWSRASSKNRSKRPQTAMSSVCSTARGGKIEDASLFNPEGGLKPWIDMENTNPPRLNDVASDRDRNKKLQSAKVPLNQP